MEWNFRWFSRVFVCRGGHLRKLKHTFKREFFKAPVTVVANDVKDTTKQPQKITEEQTEALKETTVAETLEEKKDVASLAKSVKILISSS